MSSGPEAELSCDSDMPVSEWQNTVKRQGYVEWPGGETLFSIRGMYSVRVAELGPLSGACPVAWRQNSVLRLEYVLCPSGRTLPSFRGISRVRVVEFCPALGVRAECKWQNSIKHQGNVHWEFS
ncbi:hypothetical protein TNIN_368201 [Trichonephila inaurata madagascariensis]|uniref:Uncharacterized protein n=1 Tax=Trichonephila inaurata madagascariensis TaxID=2747483 RepID=A0A8X6YRE3_9ARAC|nr:hypothetical protein TNIN_368201 [Trichonephila inaurata madagascariensis]